MVWEYLGLKLMKENHQAVGSISKGRDVREVLTAYSMRKLSVNTYSCLKGTVPAWCLAASPCHPPPLRPWQQPPSHQPLPPPCHHLVFLSSPAWEAWTPWSSVSVDRMHHLYFFIQYLGIYKYISGPVFKCKSSCITSHTKKDTTLWTKTLHFTCFQRNNLKMIMMYSHFSATWGFLSMVGSL